MKKKESFKSFFRDESDRKVFEKVFEKHAIETLYNLSTKGWFQQLEHIISTGKEAHVFKAVDSKGNPRAVKIYKISTSNFKHMGEYLKGDIRFKNIGRNKRDIIFAWAKKEYRNLHAASAAGVECPMPLAFKENILVMSFIGSEDAAKSLKDIRKIKNGQKLYQNVIENYGRLVYKGGLVHSDLSEYNILYHENKPYFIDFGQALLLKHAKAKEFFKRDIKNITNYFRKIGIEKTQEEAEEDIKEWKEKIKAGKQGNKE